MNSLKSLSRSWDSAAADYRYGAFWFWNMEPSEEEMRRRVRAMADAGLRYVVIHPIHGLTVEYLSEEYCRWFRFGLTLLREAGLRAWIYDEFGWPSGNAGGKLLREYPEFRGWHLAFERADAGGIRAEVRRTGRVLDSVTGAPWCRGEAGYLDTLNADAVSAFVEMTHQHLWDAVGEELFRETVIGFFTDEPAAMMDNPSPDHTLWQARSLPWTPALPELFRQRYGIRIEEHYEELAEPRDKELRHRYMALVSELYETAYFGTIARWCHGHDVLFTGHLGEDFPGQGVRFSGNLPRCLAALDEPGIDYLGFNAPAAERIEEFTLISTVARRNGKNRIFCEAFGVSPMTLTPRRMLHETQIMGLYGIDNQALMGIHQSFRGIRKHLYWPPLFHEAPWWPAFGALNRAAARSLALTRHGERRIRYAIYYPQDQLELLPVLEYEVYDSDEPVCRALRELLLALQARGESACYLFAEDLDALALRPDGGIGLNDECFEALIVLPQFEISPEHRRKLERFSAVIHPGIPEEEQFPQTDLLCHTFDFADGEMRIFNNRSCERSVRLTLDAPGDRELTLWNPVTGILTVAPAELELEPQESCAVSNTARGWLKPEPEKPTCRIAELPQDGWSVTLEAGNACLFDAVRFRAGQSDWIPGESAHTAPGCQRIPDRFGGACSLEFQAEFTVSESLPETALVWESGRIAALALDGSPLSLDDAKTLPLWDVSCCRLALARLEPGVHRLEGRLLLEPFETGMHNDGFFLNTPMPSLDLLLLGNFAETRHGLKPWRREHHCLPFSLRDQGILHPVGCVRLARSLPVEMPEARFRVNCAGAGELAVRLDGGEAQFSFAQTIHLPALSQGVHGIELELYPVSGFLFGNQSLDCLIASEGTHIRPNSRLATPEPCMNHSSSVIR